MKVQILHATVDFFDRTLSKPLRLSKGLISELTEARATVTVRVNGREASGRGSIFLSDLWAWPNPAFSHAQRDTILRELCRQIARELPALCGGEAVHPLELGLRLHHSVCRAGHPPILARAMCASPFDAAIHDAAGLATGLSAFAFYREPVHIPSADPLFPSGGACASIARTLRAPVDRLDAWWIVSATNSLETDVAPNVRKRGYRCFKLKLSGTDNAADVARTIEVFRAVKQMGVRAPRLSVDSNEANPDAASVLDYLQSLRAQDRETFGALEYLEQPTRRDILQAAYDWREVAKLKPVFLDEGLTSFELFDEAVRQGWSGFALKTCKGHSFALVAAAWAREHKLLLAMQDLTNPGLAAIHSALFAAHLPVINGIELNSPQFSPEANAEWCPRLNGLFAPNRGTHRLPSPIAVGLGSVL